MTDKLLLDANRGTYESRYETLFGDIPAAILRRWAMTDRHGRSHVAALLEELRGEIQFRSSLDLKSQQLVQFAQLIVLGNQVAAELHARAALRAGASCQDLLAASETALLTAGVAGYVLGLEIIEKLEGEAVED